MQIKEMILPYPWYPKNKTGIEEFLLPFSIKLNGKNSSSANLALSPHAGWSYSGNIAGEAISSLNPDADTIVIIGGHLAKGNPFLLTTEEGVRTPLGVLMTDMDLISELGKKINFIPDSYRDNTVEVLLPMVHYFFPDKNILCMRFPGDMSSFEAGVILHDTASALGRRINIIASADLTHYGDNYGFSPQGSGKMAYDWVKNVNDRSFIDAVISGTAELVLERALKDLSCCSVGAVLGLLGFNSCQQKNAKLLAYGTSCDAETVIPSSFVGYAGIIWD